jgi:hydrogenase 3 maturation protease
MSNPCWIRSLRQTLRSLARPDRPARVAIVGVGHTLRGDDGAGPAVAQSLRECTLPFNQTEDEAGHSLSSLILDAGPAPENFTGPLRRFHPDLVLVIDAAEMGERPGAVRWLAWQDTSGLGAATHSLPLHVFASYLSAELNCDIALVGIQPNNTAISPALSPEVQRAVDRITRVLAGELARSSPALACPRAADHISPHRLL